MSQKISIVCVTGTREKLQMAAMIASVAAATGTEVNVFLSMNALDYFIKGHNGEAPAEGAPVNAFTCVVSVADVDDAVARLGELGGSVTVAKFPVPSVGWLAYARDTEGNVFGMMTMDERAA